MTMAGPVKRRSFLGPTTRRLVRSYGLLVAIALAFLLLALFVREKERTVPAETLPFGHEAIVEVA